MWKKFWEWIKHPYGWQILVFYLFTAVFVVVSIVYAFKGIGGEQNIAAYIFYALAAITVCYSVYSAVIFLSGIKQKIITFLKKFSFTNRLLEEYRFRTIVFAVVSFVISVAYAVVNATIGFAYRSTWYLGLGGYYILLALIRGGVLLFHGKKKRKYLLKESEEQIKIREIKSYRMCGYMLVLLPLALSVGICEMVYNNKTFVHAGLMIYFAAVYTVYKVAMSVYNFIKARKGDEMTIRAIRDVNLADALVSILALQTTMFHEFSTGTKYFGVANALTGAVVCAITFGLGLAMIINGYSKINEMEKEDTETLVSSEAE